MYQQGVGTMSHLARSTSFRRQVSRTWVRCLIIFDCSREAPGVKGRLGVVDTCAAPWCAIALAHRVYNRQEACPRDGG